MATPGTGLSTIGFDADDTLWQNEQLFKLTQARFAQLLAEHGEAAEIEQKLFEAETRNLRHYGYGIKGFTLSMIETAIEVSEGRVSAAVIGEIVASGRSMLSHAIETLPLALETRERLAESHRVALITKGDLFADE